MVQAVMEGNMRVVFVGTSEFGIPALEAIHGKFEIPLVISQPDRPRARGRKVLPTPIKEKATSLGIEVITPEKIAEARGRIEEVAPEVLLVVSYGQLIPKEILEIPSAGALNIHPSLLPRYRGAAPIQRAIMAGEEETGVTIMWMNERLDAGDIFLQERVEIGPEETYGELHDRLAKVSAELIVKALDMLEKGEIIRIPQREEEATYAKPISKEETEIDWSRPAREVHNLVRALSPKPGARATISGQRFKIYRARPSEGEGTPGEVVVKDVKKGILKVACGDGCLEILEIQPEGKRVMDAASFLRGYGHKI